MILQVAGSGGPNETEFSHDQPTLTRDYSFVDRDICPVGQRVCQPADYGVPLLAASIASPPIVLMGCHSIVEIAP